MFSEFWATRYMGSLFRDQGSKSHLQHWKVKP